MCEERRGVSILEMDAEGEEPAAASEGDEGAAEESDGEGTELLLLLL